MKVEFLGGAGTVTGSATLLESGSLKWLVDCGLFQGSKDLEERNRSVRPYRPEEISLILLTHAHIDHSGLIPKLVREGFKGKVVCTKATRDLCEIMLRDSAHIHEMEAEWQNRKGRRAGRDGAQPLYTQKDAENSLRCFQPVDYEERVTPAEGLRVRFRDAGHILGSAIVEIWVKEGGTEKKVVFSGDLGGLKQPIVRDPSRVDEADVLWLESTYGDRLHRSREETVQEFLGILQDAIGHHAKVVIPAFAVERTQDIIYVIGQFIRQGVLPSIPVYIDSPLAISATEIFKRNPDCFDGETRDVLLKGGDPLDLPEIIYSRTSEDSKAINEDSRPGIIISASGMCESGRIQHHLKHHLWRPESHVVIIGYQAQGTVGRRIVDGAKTIRLFGEEIAVRAHIHTLGGFSAHADQKGLLEWVSHFRNPKLEVIVNHGEEKVSTVLAQAIRRQFPFSVSTPRWREKRTLFEAVEQVPAEQVMPEREGEEEGLEVEETVSSLMKELNRSAREMSRRLKKEKSRGKQVHDPRWLKRLAEVNAELDELKSELERQ
jgi:metallo-beta-lactamase family protein